MKRNGLHLVFDFSLFFLLLNFNTLVFGVVGLMNVQNVLRDAAHCVTRVLRALPRMSL